MSGSRPSTSAASIRRRAQILEVTRDLIAERGVEKLLIADVAERSKVSVATIYNLVGTRDRLLIALLDDVAERTRARLAAQAVEPGIAGCVQVVTIACETSLEDAETTRSIIANLGSAAPDQWLAEGLESSILEQVEAAVDAGELTTDHPAQAITSGIQLGFRGALISWVFGVLSGEALTANAECMALHVLVNAASSEAKPDAARRLRLLTLQLTGGIT